MTEPPRKKIHTILEATEKARAYCAFQERCQQEMRDKLYYWGLHKEDVEAIIAQLIIEGFIKEERFARSFARGKFRMKKWGKLKIELELKKRKISEYCINKALEELDEQDYSDTIQSLIAKKRTTLKNKDSIQDKYKIANYVISKGYCPELVWNELNKK